MPSHDDAARHYDVIVVGAGPAGEAVAELGGNLGYSVALVERDTVGGTVITSGGAPTKTFREAAVYLSSFERRATQPQIADGVGAVRSPAGPPVAATSPNVTHWRMRNP